MPSITKIIILITAIIAISENAFCVLGKDMNQPGALVFDTPYSVQQDPPYKRNCDGIIGFLGCITTDFTYPMTTDYTDYYDVMQPEDPSFTNTEYTTISEYGSDRLQQQAVDKTKSSDDGPNSVMSLLARSSSPLGSMLRKRNRRSPLIPGTSSNKNTTEEARPAVVTNRPPKLTNGQRILISFLSILTTPYLLITPNLDYDYGEAIYTS
ncbi:hypothetical protein QTP88_011573 [Uroleucon formosanum]